MWAGIFNMLLEIIVLVFFRNIFVWVCNNKNPLILDQTFSLFMWLMELSRSELDHVGRLCTEQWRSTNIFYKEPICAFCLPVSMSMRGKKAFEVSIMINFLFPYWFSLHLTRIMAHWKAGIQCWDHECHCWWNAARLALNQINSPSVPTLFISQTDPLCKCFSHVIVFIVTVSRISSCLECRDGGIYILEENKREREEKLPKK